MQAASTEGDQGQQKREGMESTGQQGSGHLLAPPRSFHPPNPPQAPRGAGLARTTRPRIWTGLLPQPGRHHPGAEFHQETHLFLSSELKSSVPASSWLSLWREPSEGRGQASEGQRFRRRDGGWTGLLRLSTGCMGLGHGYLVRRDPPAVLLWGHTVSSSHEPQPSPSTGPQHLPSP